MIFSVKGGAMKTLVVFYSLEGNTRFLADIIANELEADVLELQPEKEIPKEGFKKYIWGGKSVFFKEKPRLLNHIPNLNEYETLFVGTPIWASSYAPPLATFLTENILQNKKIGLFACHMGGGADKCFSKLSQLLQDNTIIGTIDFTEPLKDDKEKVKIKIKRWLHDIT